MMDDWNKTFTHEELVAIEAAFKEAEAAFSTASSSSCPSQVKTSCTSTSSSGEGHDAHFMPNACYQYPSSASCFKYRGGSARNLGSLTLTPCSLHQERTWALQVRFKKQPREQHVCSSPVRFQIKRPRVPTTLEEAGIVRKWNEMDHDILVTIMKYLRGQSVTLNYAFHMCKSWASAVLDSIFPPGDMLDLRFFDAVTRIEMWYYLFYLKFLLGRPHQYTKLFFPTCDIRRETATKIAQRLPTLKCILQLKCCVPSIFKYMIPYWPELNEAHCHAGLIQLLSEHCKNIRRLDLWGRIGDDKACRLAFHLPQLMHLNIQACILSPNALSIILQGHPNLTYLDTRHAFCIEPPIWRPIEGRVIEWDEVEVRQKVIGVKTYMHCARKYCSYCAPLYSPNISNKDLARFFTM